MCLNLYMLYCLRDTKFTSIHLNIHSIWIAVGKILCRFNWQYHLILIDIVGKPNAAQRAV